jgi:hypothetical protein
MITGIKYSSCILSGVEGESTFPNALTKTERSPSTDLTWTYSFLKSPPIKSRGIVRFDMAFPDNQNK